MPEHKDHAEGECISCAINALIDKHIVAGTPPEEILGSVCHSLGCLLAVLPVQAGQRARLRKQAFDWVKQSEREKLKEPPILIHPDKGHA